MRIFHSSTIHNMHVRSLQRVQWPGRSRLMTCLLFLVSITMILASSSAVVTTTTGVVDGIPEESVPSTTCSSVDGNCEAPDIFEPTHEWKDILPHQHIPGGLHVRINLSTGKKEAKLLDEEGDEEVSTEDYDQVEQDVKETDDTDAMILSDEASISVDGIVQVLQGLPEPPKISDMDIHEAHATLDPVEFKRHIVKLWKDRQTMLRDAMDSMQDSATHLQTLIDSILPIADRYDKGWIHHNEEEEEKETQAYLIALEEIEWAVQDLDQAKDFHTLGGFVLIVDILSHASLRLSIRASAAWVLGSAIKHYDEAQDWALDVGALESLLSALVQHLPSSTSGGEMYLMQKKCLYALGALIRVHPRAQRLFGAQSGVEILSTYMDEATHSRLKLKIVQLVRDILTEESPPQESSPLLTLQQSFRSTDWCLKVCREITTTTTSTLDYAQEVLKTLESQLTECTLSFAERREVQRTLEHFVTTVASLDKDEPHLLMQAQDLMGLLQ